MVQKDLQRGANRSRCQLSNLRYMLRGRRGDLKHYVYLPYACTFTACSEEFSSEHDWLRHENLQHEGSSEPKDRDVQVRQDTTYTQDNVLDLSCGLEDRDAHVHLPVAMDSSTLESDESLQSSSWPHTGPDVDDKHVDNLQPIQVFPNSNPVEDISDNAF